MRDSFIHSFVRSFVRSVAPHERYVGPIRQNARAFASALAVAPRASSIDARLDAASSSPLALGSRVSSTLARDVGVNF